MLHGDGVEEEVAYKKKDKNRPLSFLSETQDDEDYGMMKYTFRAHGNIV